MVRLTVLLVLAGFAAAAQQRSSEWERLQQEIRERTRGPAQPVAFSHKQHLAFNLECDECHATPDPGARVTMPSANDCMACHSIVAREKPSIQKIAGYARSAQPIPWTQVYRVRDYVHWSHRTHMASGRKCESCHGPVDQVELMTASMDITSMQSCMDCHRRTGASNDCKFCHDER